MNETALLPRSARETLPASHQPLPFMQFDGINKLVSASMPLLLLMIRLKQTEQVRPHQVIDLRRQVITEIMAFVERANKLHCSPRLVLAARYCLCTALDEVALATPWGNESAWSHQTLLSIVQKETWGGERFFIILEEMAKAPEDNLPLLELLYMILSLGFEGKYYGQELAVRDEIRHRLFHLIMMHREEPDKWLSPSLKVLETTPLLIQPRFSKRKIAGFTLLAFLGIGIIFNVATYVSGRSVLHEFAGISSEIQHESTSVQRYAPRLVRGVPAE